MNFFAPGRMISGSKSHYTTAHPHRVIIFNANLCTDKGKFWYGDIDLTIDECLLIELAKELKTTIYILLEHDARFENESNPLLEKAVAKVTSTGITFQ